MAGTDSVPYQRMIRVMKGERLILPKASDMHKRGWRGIKLSHPGD